jgi:hypothetical protein
VKLRLTFALVAGPNGHLRKPSLTVIDGVGRSWSALM